MAVFSMAGMTMCKRIVIILIARHATEQYVHSPNTEQDRSTPFQSNIHTEHSGQVVALAALFCSTQYPVGSLSLSPPPSLVSCPNSLPAPPIGTCAVRPPPPERLIA